MTIESTRSKSTYAGNGATTVFPFAFKVWDASQLKVSITSPDGVLATATGWKAELTETGGSVTYLRNGSPLPSGWRLAITRDMPFIQGVDLISGTRFDPEVIERALDTATAERQQLLEVVSRAIQMPVTSNSTPEEYGQELLSANDTAVSAANSAQASAQSAKSSAEKSTSEADRARDEANRAGQLATLAQHAKNFEATITLSSAVAAGQKLTLPVYYIVGTNGLRLNLEGVELFRGVSFTEIGDENTLSNTITLLMDIPAGNRLNLWVIASNVAYAVEQAEKEAAEAAERAALSATNADGSARAAKTSADQAAKTVQQATAQAVSQAEAQANRAQNEAALAEAAVKNATAEARQQAEAQVEVAAVQAGIATNAALEATEQADRSETAATDAERAARKAQAAACGKGIAVAQAVDMLDDAPDGFYFIDASLVVPSTCALPVNTEETVELVPELDGFYFIGLDAHCPDPCPPETDSAVLTLCGKRRKLLSA